MSEWGEPENEVYWLTKAGTLGLLEAVDAADTKGAIAKASRGKPCDAVSAYLDAAFLGSFLRSGHEPYAENAGSLGTYVDFLDGELARGATHATSLHQVHLKLLVYVAAIEASAPLSLFGNGLGFLAGKQQAFDVGIYYKLSSAGLKLEKVGRGLDDAVDAPTSFRDLHTRLQQLFDRDLRNAIAHATYRVHTHDKRVDIWNKGQLETSHTFQEIDDRYRDARCYQQGFVAAVSDFARAIHPDCPYVWHP